MTPVPVAERLTGVRVADYFRERPPGFGHAAGPGRESAGPRVCAVGEVDVTTCTSGRGHRLRWWTA
ncbi:hypothetical protein GCM10010335_45530 [Streptomyces galbus]|nr:hypothetical protein GCM10010335_45530 [Streptomyces galbus]